VRLHEGATARTELGAKGLGVEDAAHRGGKSRRVIRDEDVLSGLRRDALRPERGGHHRAPHGHGLEDFEARAAAHPQGDDGDGCS
jgi:hypothetical protein